MKNFFNFLKSKTFLIQLGLALVVLVVFIFGVLQWLNNSTNHGEFVEVPDLAKLTVTEMRKVIDDADLRYEVLDSANYNPDFPRFSVIEQNPPAGNKVKQNRKVYVTVIKYKGKYIEEGYKLPKTSKVELVCGNGYESEGSKVKSASEE